MINRKINNQIFISIKIFKMSKLKKLLNICSKHNLFFIHNYHLEITNKNF